MGWARIFKFLFKASLSLCLLHFNVSYLHDRKLELMFSVLISHISAQSSKPLLNKNYKNALYDTKK